ncbi:MAG TPA: hypothetical protein VFP84_31670 [Kofleriaceae bacterium]|nr:hypothetical protein [Kofleriaceae bacterium]
MPDLAALHREVHARPDADDARLVLADALLAAGDPRGELIALQLADAGGGTARGIDRIERLLREHGKRWLGPLREFTYRAQFARGFVRRLELDGRWTASDAGWARHADEPALATIEDLLPGRAVGDVYARFVASPALAALRRIEVFDRPTLAALRATPARLTHVACPRWKAGSYVRELTAHVLPACERFAELRSFAVHLDGVPAVLASRVLPRLRALTVAGGLAHGLTLWPRLPAATSLTIARTAMLDACTASRVAWPGELELVRAPDGGVIGRGAGAWLVGKIVQHFAALPAGVRRLEIAGAGVHGPALADLARRRGIELALVALPRRTGYVRS